MVYPKKKKNFSGCADALTEINKNGPWIQNNPGKILDHKNNVTVLDQTRG